MMDKKIGGFCKQVNEAVMMLGYESVDELMKEKDIRKILKKKIILVQEKRIKEKMILASKTDGMFPTKVNFPGRWSDNILWNVCGQLDTVAHLFVYEGYSDSW